MNKWNSFIFSFQEIAHHFYTETIPTSSEQLASREYARETGQAHVDTGDGDELSTAIEEGSPKTKTRTSTRSSCTTLDVY